MSRGPRPAGVAGLHAALRAASTGLRQRRRRALVTALGIGLATAMLTAAGVISYGLGTGFDRAAQQADLPDIIVRFHPVAARTIAARIRALPDIARLSLRQEVTEAGFSYGTHRTHTGVAEVLDDPGRDQGYALVAGRPLPRRRPGVLVERGLAAAWGIPLGGRLVIDGLGPEPVVGYAEGPDDVGYPLAAPRVYLSRPALDARFGRPADPAVDLADIWLRDPRYVDEVLAQARAIAYGLRDLQFVTRSGVRVLVGQAAGIVIDLLVALSVIALVTAGALLGASARVEVGRRLRAIGVRRAIGESRGQVAGAQALEGLIVSLPAATLGALAGVLVTAAPDARLLTLLNEPAPGTALVLPVVGTWLLGTLLPAAGGAWPAWRASGDPVVGLLRGGDLAPRSARWTGVRRRSSRRGRIRGARAGGLIRLGARLAVARRGRLLATVVTLSLSSAFVLLMLALAATLSTLETDPRALGRRYALTAALPPSAAARVRRIPGVAAVAPRFEVSAADSFALGETVDVIAYPADHVAFEAPPLESGHRLDGTGEAEVGQGLADALGLADGSTLALALSSGSELRLRVSGIVSSLDQEGRVAYVPAGALLRANPSAARSEQLAIVLSAGADQAAVQRALRALGAAPAPAAGATARGIPLVDVLRTILRAVAIVDGLVCLYALGQACGLTVLERRRTLAVLRAGGGGPAALRRLLSGSMAVLVAPAGLIGIALERWVLGPALSHLAINYAVLDLAAGPRSILADVAGLSLAAGAAVSWVARAASRGPVAEGLTE